MGKHLTAFEAGKLQPGERVERSVAGFVQDRTAFEGELILTDQRVCFYRKGLMGEVFESVPLSKITSVEARSTLGFRKLKLHTSNDETEFKVVGSKEAFDQFYSRLEALRHSSPAAPDRKPPTAVSAVDQLRQSSIDQLRQLGELAAAGILSPAEFEAKKAELLSRI